MSGYLPAEQIVPQRSLVVVANVKVQGIFASVLLAKILNNGLQSCNPGDALVLLFVTCRTGLGFEVCFLVSSMNGLSILND